MILQQQRELRYSSRKSRIDAIVKDAVLSTQVKHPLIEIARMEHNWKCVSGPIDIDGIFNARKDRLDRTPEFIDDMRQKYDLFSKHMKDAVLSYAKKNSYTLNKGSGEAFLLATAYDIFNSEIRSEYNESLFCRTGEVESVNKPVASHIFPKNKSALMYHEAVLMADVLDAIGCSVGAFMTWDNKILISGSEFILDLSPLARHVNARENIFDAYLCPRECGTNAFLAMEHNNWGDFLLKNGLYKDAAEQYSKAIDLFGDYHEATYNMAYAQLRIGNYKKSAALFDKVLKKLPNIPDAIFHKMEAQVAMHDFLATENIELAVYMYPKIAEFHFVFGETHRMNGNMDEAIIEYNKALELNPKYYDAALAIGKTFCDFGKLDEAATAFQHAILIDPDDAEGWWNLYLVLSSRGSINPARSAYYQAIERDPSLKLLNIRD